MTLADAGARTSVVMVMMRASRMNVASKLSQVDSLVDYSGRLAELGSHANQSLWSDQPPIRSERGLRCE
jgi:hypothetical protein